MITSGDMSIADRQNAKNGGTLTYGTSARVLRTRQDIDALAQRWRALEAQGSGATPFQSLGWVQAVLDFEASRGNKDFDPVIVVLEARNALVAILPLERVKTFARRILVPLGRGYAQYADILLAPGIDPLSATQQLLDAAINAAPCDVISLLKVRDGSALAKGLPQHAIETGTRDGAPYVALDAFPDFTSYFSTIRTKTRKNMRNGRNRLEREGPVEHFLFRQSEDCLALIERTLAGRAERLREQGLTSRAFRDTSFPAFCKSLARRPDSGLMAFSLTLNGRPISEQWGFEHGGRYYCYMTTRDFSHSDESPGKLHFAEILKACAEMNLAGCDLGVPIMPYKLTFATSVVEVHDVALPVTARGVIITRLWDVMLRPALKALALRMPASWRARLMRAAVMG
jgi:CelD/BcsL family acetyltransferase involved in cellulose biosynthesis